MEISSYFTDFLEEIRPTPNEINDYKTGHRTLVKRLKADEILKKIIISTFLQGSYRRATAITASAGKCINRSMSHSEIGVSRTPKTDGASTSAAH